MATVLVDVRPPQYVQLGELQRIQVQRSAAHNKSNDSVSTPTYEVSQSSSQDASTIPVTTLSLEPDDLSIAVDTANALMAETDPESSDYLGTQLNVYA
jgi:hypothetical protein